MGVKEPLTVLSIETSCDETAAAVIKDGKILSEQVASQIDIHKKFGGVVPELASRNHLKKLNLLIQSALEEAGLEFNDLEAVAVTAGPGLEGSLLVGLTTARTLAMLLDIELVEVDHLEAHLFAAKFSDVPAPPGIGLVVSGGHTRLIYIKEWGNYEIIGRTRDDAAGEAFDKVASIVGLGYPGGPAIEKAARRGDGKRFKFPVSNLGDSLDFSYSGIKTSVLYKVKYDLKGELSSRDAADIAASFQYAALTPLVENAVRAALKYKTKWIFAGGGVSANSALKERLTEAATREGIKAFFPAKSHSTDNASMVGACGAFYLRKS
ncbi:MAG: tRNA (adenosine(37)-N6)-threonylcarbamoyltransferase complex transferase subunit TsaD [Elusimicrobiota bacterium]|nr:tRNA (adenosine(37)-N6)-threonylcarbamoyltransferase complex transferase subunit TsaD [Elusimicrobiota bacterium]